MRKEVVKAVLVVFVASFCTMVIELVAGGSWPLRGGFAIYVDLDHRGRSGGDQHRSLCGGILADRRIPPPRLSAGCCLLPVWPPLHLSFNRVVARWQLETSLMVRILAVTAVIFFVPSTLLGMISRCGSPFSGSTGTVG